MRHELKYVIPQEELERCLNIIQEHPYSFVSAFADRRINNIYLDDPAHTAVHETHSGVANRKKYRIRWYGNWHQPLNALFEIKIKRNQLGEKVQHGLSQLSLDLEQDLKDLVNRNLIPANLIISTSNSYLRS